MLKAQFRTRRGGDRSPRTIAKVGYIKRVMALTVCCSIAATGLTLVSLHRASATISYGPSRSEVADICQPPFGFGMRPGVLLIHGGGWVGGDKAAYSDRCRALARQGYTVMNVNYRLATGAPEHAWPAALDDACMAFGWMQKNAPALDLDSKRIGVLGDSAGGQLAIFLGVDGRRSGIRCVVEESGPVDLLTAPSFVAAVSPAVFLAQPIQTTYRNASPCSLLAETPCP